MSPKARLKLCILETLTPCEDFPLAENLLLLQVQRAHRPTPTEEQVKEALTEMLAARQLVSVNDTLDEGAREFSLTTKGKAALAQ